MLGQSVREEMIDYECSRPPPEHAAAVVLLCFPLVSAKLAECLAPIERDCPGNTDGEHWLAQGWLSYMEELAPDARIVLVGTRWDLRSGDSQTQCHARAEDMAALVARLREAGHTNVMGCVEPAGRKQLAGVFEAAACAWAEGQRLEKQRWFWRPSGGKWRREAAVEF
jgi:hypothetical protein